MKKFIKKHGWIIGTLFVLTVLIFWRLFTKDFNDARVLGMDGLEMYFPIVSQVIKTFVREHHILTWNPLIGSGQPLFVDGGIFYWPQYFLAIFLRNGLLKYKGYEIFTVFHVFVAAIGMYFYMFNKTKKRIAGIVSAMIFAFGGYMIQSQWPILIIGLALLPWILFCFKQTLKKKNILYALLTGMLLAWQFSIYPQFCFYTVVAIVLLVVIDFFIDWKIDSQKILWLIIIFASFGMFGAIAILPALSLSGSSFRQSLFSITGKYGYSHYSSEVFPTLFKPRDLLNFIRPFRGDTNYFDLYLGVFSLFFVWLGFKVKNIKPVIKWTLLGIFFFLFALNTSPLFDIFFLTTPISQFRWHLRAIALSYFAFAVIAGLGAGYLSEIKIEWQKVRFYLKYFLVISVLVGVFFLSQTSMEILVRDSIGYIFITGLLLFFFLYLHSNNLLSRKPLAILVLAFLAFDLIANASYLQLINRTYSRSLVPKSQYAELGDYPFNTSSANSEFSYRLPSDSTFGGNNRLSYIGISQYRAYTNSGAEFSYSTLLNYHNFLLRADKNSDGDYRNPKLMELINVKDEGLNPLPRAFFVSKAKYKTADEILNYMDSDDFDPRKSVVLEGDSGNSDSVGETTFFAVDIDRFENNTFYFKKFTAPSAGWLVISDNYYDGWEANVNSASKEVLRADYTFKAVKVEKGDNDVDMAFRPKNYLFAAAVSCSGYILLLGVLVFGFIKKRKKLKKFSKPNRVF